MISKNPKEHRIQEYCEHFLVIDLQLKWTSNEMTLSRLLQRHIQ